MKKLEIGFFGQSIRYAIGVDQLNFAYSDQRITDIFTPLWFTIRDRIEEPLELQRLSWDE